MDFDGCELTERIPGKQDGVPLVKGTRIPAQQIVEEFQLGSSIADIARNYELAPDQVRRLVAFGTKPKPQLVP